MFTNIVSVLVFLYGVVSLVFSKQLGFETNLYFYGQMFLAVVIGGGLFTYENIGKLASLKGLIPSAKPKTDSKIFVPEDYEVKDFEAITHLRDRCVMAGSDDGLKACAALAAILFQLDMPKKV